MNKNCWKCLFFIERDKQMWEDYGIAGVCAQPKFFRRPTVYNPAAQRCGYFESLSLWAAPYPVTPSQR